MAPCPTGTAFCMALPRMRRSRAVSATRQAAGGGKRRIFAERMAGHEGGIALEIEPGLGLQHADRREADRHQGRLGVGRQGQVLGRPLPHEGGELLGEGLVHLVENGPGLREGIGQGLAHADRLAALPGKNECARHQEWNPQFNESARDSHPEGQESRRRALRFALTCDQIRRRHPRSICRLTGGLCKLSCLMTSSRA